MKGLKNGIFSFALMAVTQISSAEIIIYDLTAEAEGRALAGSITVDTDGPMYSDENHIYASDQIVDAELFIDGIAAGEFAGARLSHYFPEDGEYPYASFLGLRFTSNDMFGDIGLSSNYESAEELRYGLDAASFLDAVRGFWGGSLGGLGGELFVSSSNIAHRPPVSVPEPSVFMLSIIGLTALLLSKRRRLNSN